MKQELPANVTPHGQEHLLQFWEELSDEQRSELSEQIRSTDFGRFLRLLDEGDGGRDVAELAAQAEPPPAIRLSGDANEIDRNEAIQRGRAALADGEVGVALVAGGQGSRLGFDHPKGMFPIGPLSGATLFQVLIEKMRAAAGRHGVSIPLYLMTSPATDSETRDYFAEQKNFGFPAEDVIIFCQGTTPAVDAETKKFLLAARHQLFQSPDGHGGMLAALRRDGALRDMQRRGIRHLFYFQVDNPLATVCDEEFIGYHILAGSQYTLQVVAKSDPLEKVGNVVSIDGRQRVIEYSDLPAAAAQQRNADGSLTIWAGSIAVHVFDVEFLVEMAESDSSLPFHLALKKVPYVGENGQLVDPVEPNAVKFEKFIFDLLPRADRSLTVEVAAADAFAPLKNASGAVSDTPEFVQEQMIAQHRRWLRAAGAEVGDNVRVEISPLFAMDTKELAEKIESGTSITTDTYLE